MLERLVCNTYCVKLHRPEGDRFSVVRIQIFALPVRSHLAGFFKGGHIPDLERLDFSSKRLLAPVERKIS